MPDCSQSSQNKPYPLGARHPSVQSTLRPPVSPGAATSNTIVLFGEVVIDVFPGREVPGGSPFNVARHLRAFGLSPVLVSRAGSDARGEFVLNFMRRYGLDVRGVQRDALRPTGQVTVHIDEQGQHFEVLRDQAFDYIHAGVARLVALAVQPQMYYFGTLAQRCPVGRHALSVLLHSVVAPKMFDLNLRDAWYEPNTVERGLREADIAKMDTRELRMIAKAFRISGRNDAEIAARLVERFSLQQIVVTDREETWVLAAEENESSAVRATSGCSIADTPGANDAFAAVYLLGTLERWPTALTLNRATEFSVEVARIQGASLSDEGIYSSFMSKWER